MRRLESWEPISSLVEMHGIQLTTCTLKIHNAMHWITCRPCCDVPKITNAGTDLDLEGRLFDLVGPQGVPLITYILQHKDSISGLRRTAQDTHRDAARRHGRGALAPAHSSTGPKGCMPSRETIQLAGSASGLCVPRKPAIQGEGVWDEFGGVQANRRGYVSTDLMRSEAGKVGGLHASVAPPGRAALCTCTQHLHVAVCLCTCTQHLHGAVCLCICTQGLHVAVCLTVSVALTLLCISFCFSRRHVYILSLLSPSFFPFPKSHHSQMVLLLSWSVFQPTSNP